MYLYYILNVWCSLFLLPETNYSHNLRVSKQSSGSRESSKASKIEKHLNNSHFIQSVKNV